MNTRLVLFLVALAILSVLIVYAVAVVLPERGITQTEPSLSIAPLFAPGRPPAVPGGGILVVPPDRLSRPGFWLRPFGLQRQGLAGVWWYLSSFVTLIVLAVMTLFLVPRRLGMLARVMSNGWGQRVLALVIGLLGYLGMGLLLFLIFINVVGWPILLILLFLVYVATVIGLVAVSLAIGAGVCRFFRLDDRGPLFHLGVGVVLLFLGSILPYLGWLVVGGSAAVGFGTVLWTRCGDIKGWSLDEVVD